jgi:hypothetical protein
MYRKPEKVTKSDDLTKWRIGLFAVCVEVMAPLRAATNILCSIDHDMIASSIKFHLFFRYVGAHG